MILDPLINAFKGQKTAAASENYVPSTEEEKKQLMFNKLGPQETFHKWTAEAKISRSQYNTRFLRMFAIIGVVIGILLALMQDFVLIIVIASVIFFYYTLHNKYTPGVVEYEISNYGFKYGTQMYYWIELRHFFFSQRANQELLIIDTNENFAGRLVVIFKPEDKQKILGYLKERILYLEKEPKNSIDKFVDSVTGKFNVEG